MLYRQCLLFALIINTSSVNTTGFGCLTVFHGFLIKHYDGSKYK